MHGLQTMHRLNNPTMYELTEADMRNIRMDLMWPAAMVPLLPELRTPWETVRLQKALAYSAEVMRELNAREPPKLRLVK